MNFKQFFILFLLLSLTQSLFAEEGDSWELNAEVNLYVFQDETFLNPALSADNGKIHLEARYNDEDLDTTSFFAGYNFEFGEEFSVQITPMFGAVLGNSNGVAPGLMFELSYKAISFSSEMEYLFSSDEKESNFFYAWSEIAYSPVDWFWVGIAGERTRLYESELEIQRGFLIGFGIGNFAFTGYWMNPGEDQFGVFSAEYSF